MRGDRVAGNSSSTRHSTACATTSRMHGVYTSEQELDSAAAAFVPRWCARWLAVEDEPSVG
eukprot:6191789-Alexandrium_andersonii.AAC.1